MSNLPNFTDNGLINLKSTQPVKVTTDRLEEIIKAKGMNIVARVNHAAAAEKIGEILRPTELILFGNPQAGTPLMQSQQSVGIDLPQKILVWEDDQGKVWLTYNNPDYLKARHGIEGCDELIDNISKALDGISHAASAD